jgi:hypothetical protein
MPARSHRDEPPTTDRESETVTVSAGGIVPPGSLGTPAQARGIIEPDTRGR